MGLGKSINSVKGKGAWNRKKFVMAWIGSKWWGSRLIEIILIGFLLMAPLLVSAKESVEQEASSYKVKEEVEYSDYVTEVMSFLWQPGRLGYEHVWPVSPTFVVVYNGCIIL